MLIKENDIFRSLTNTKKWHDKRYTGKGVKVVLLDGSGKAREHMKDYYTDVLGKETDQGHATNVGFTVHQFAPDAKIYMFDFKRNKSEAIKWIADHEDEIDLINVSLAGLHGMPAPTFAPFEHLDIPLICASGNDDFEDRISYPAKYDWTIAIGAVHYNYSTESINVAPYSNEGENLDAVAFSGINMLRDDGYTWSVQGTSFASPTAVGMLACYIQWRKEQVLPKATTKDLRKFIHENTIDIGIKGFDTASGHGLFVLPELNIFEDPRKEKTIEGGETTVREQYELPEGFKKAKVTYKGNSVNAIIIEGRTYVQVRDLGETMGLKVGWIPSTSTATLSD